MSDVWGAPQAGIGAEAAVMITAAPAPAFTPTTRVPGALQRMHGVEILTVVAVEAVGFV